MSEELIQKHMTEQGLKVGNYEFYNIGNSTLNQLKKFNIIPRKNYSSYGSYRPDALLVDKTDKKNTLVIAVMEWKKHDKFLSEKDKLKSIKQCNNIAQELGAKIGIATDGNEFIWYNTSPSLLSLSYRLNKKSKSSGSFKISKSLKNLKIKSSTTLYRHFSGVLPVAIHMSCQTPFASCSGLIGSGAITVELFLSRRLYRLFNRLIVFLVSSFNLSIFNSSDFMLIINFSFIGLPSTFVIYVKLLFLFVLLSTYSFSFKDCSGLNLYCSPLIDKDC